jgi:hydroxyethylthiazole kinase
MIDQLQMAKERIKDHKPLVLCLTNYVTMDFIANVLLAIGAAPIMSCEEGELEALITLSSAVYLNLGTLDERFLSRSDTAIQIAKQLQKPVILDPVGAGASAIRSQSAQALMNAAQIIRGNASEIMALTDTTIQTAGVESTQSTLMGKESADLLARQLNNTVIISGPEDYVSNGKLHISLEYGSALMPLVTGMGCALTAVVAAFAAVEDDYFTAAKLATAYFGLCGEQAERVAKKPGAFRTAFIDAIYSGVQHAI